MTTRRWLTIYVLTGIAGLLLALYLNANWVGISIEQSQGSVRVSAASSPLVLFWSAFMLGCILAVGRAKYTMRPARRASRIKRTTALYLDLFLFLGNAAGILALAQLISEAIRTSRFEWQFERDYTVWQDYAVVYPAIAAALAGLAIYKAWPIRNRRQTIGGFLLHIAVIYEGAGQPSWPNALKAEWLDFEETLESWIPLFKRKLPLLSKVGCAAVTVE
jgi:hypothetical protein